MTPLFLILNIICIPVTILIAWAASTDRKNVNWLNVGLVLGIEVIIGAFLVFVEAGRNATEAAATGFANLVGLAYSGISFALPDWVPVGTYSGSGTGMNFVTSALLPILLIVPLFDILTYIGVLPFIIKWVGKGLSYITRRPRFESFYSIEMMLLGNTEALGVSRLQIEKLSPTRNVTIAMMSMSCVTAAIIGAYTTMVPGQYVITAIPLNILGAIVITSVLNPVTIKPEEDFVVDASGNIEYCDPEYLAELAEKEAAKTKAKKSASKDSKSAAKGSKSKSKLIDIENDATYSGDGKTAHGKDLEDTKRVKLPPFFMFLGDSILNAGKLILIILANVIAFVAIAETINRGLDLIPFINTLTGGGKEVTDAITGLPAVAADGSAVLTYGEPLQYLFGIVLSPIAVLFGFNFTEAFEMAKLMGTKLVTNEFVVMGQLGGPEAFVAAHSAHYVAVLTVFLTSFANFSTVGMVIGCYKGIADEKSNEAVASQVPRIFLSGVLVSVLSAAVAGMFCW